jgi:hypothetical protein
MPQNQWRGWEIGSDEESAFFHVSNREWREAARTNDASSCEDVDAVREATWAQWVGHC